MRTDTIRLTSILAPFLAGLLGGASLLSFGQAAEPIPLANSSLALGFDPARGGLTSFIDKTAPRQLIEPAPDRGDVWEIRFPTAAGLKTVSSSQAGSFRCETVAGSCPTLRLVWEHFADPAAPARVEANVRLDPSAPVSFWNLRLSGLGQVVPRQVRFPILHGLTRSSIERLAVPEWLGQEHSDPRRLFHDQQGRGRRIEWAYPGLLSLQCAAFYPPGSAGLYLACDDINAYVKGLAFFGEAAGGLSCEWTHYPEQDMVRRGNWSLPYQVVVGSFVGDWFAAAERYRGWATNQPWTASSRLTRGAIPAWVLDTGLWVWNRGRSPGVLAPARELQRQAGLPVSVFWHWWHGCAYDSGFPEYLPPREGNASFKAALDAAHRDGLHALVYMNQRLWGMTTESWRTQRAKRFAVKGADGRVHPESYNTFTNTPCASMCMGTAFWRDHYADLAVTAIRQLGVDGIYMDQACTSLACYDPSHGHPLGGGTYWIGGFRLLASDLRRRAGVPTLDPNPVHGAAQFRSRPDQPALAGEGCGEAWLPYLDLMLSLQVSKERYAGPDGWEPIPFFPAVYHPYAVSYGNYSSLTMPPYDDLWPASTAPAEPLQLLDRKFSRQFYLEQARAFAWGQQPTIANFQTAHLTQRTEEIDYVVRLARLRRNATKYLLHGVTLRAPVLSVPETMIDMSRLSIYAGQQGGLKSFQKNVSPAIGAAWRAPDGDQAIVLASLSDQPLSLDLLLQPEQNALPKTTEVFRLDDRGRSALGALGHFTPRITLPPRGACLLEFVLPPH